MSQKAFALHHSRGGIILPSVRHNEMQVRMYAVEVERKYLLSGEDHLTDKQLWKRCYGQGFRVKPVRVSTLPPTGLCSPRTCERCNGAGLEPGGTDASIQCFRCYGTGEDPALSPAKCQTGDQRS